MLKLMVHNRKLASRKLSSRVIFMAAVVVVLLVLARMAFSQGTDELRNEVARQKATIEAQRKVLDEQSKRLDELIVRLSALERDRTDGRPTKVIDASGAEKAASPDSAAQQAQKAGDDERDPIGDLNSVAVRAGEFPGSFRIGEGGKVSLRFGGFIKGVGYYDSNYEGRAPVAPPSLFGLGRLDERGGLAFSGALSRFNVDARASAPGGRVRGYIEFDFSGANNFSLRHAYLSYTTPRFQILAGQTWTNFMDLRAIPEALAEPYPSSLVFARQAQFAWSQQLGKGFYYTVAVEDPGSSDVPLNNPADFRRSRIPDFVGNFGFGREKGHVQVAGLLRRTEFISGSGVESSGTGWGVHVGANFKPYKRGNIAGSYVYGEGIAKYILGADPFSGGYLDSNDRLELRTNYGGFLSFQHIFNDKFRTNFWGGYSSSTPGREQFASSTYKRTANFSGNVLYRINPFMTFGVEYIYGRRIFLGDPSKENHRILFGFQVF